jgi:hypothetical protein
MKKISVIVATLVGAAVLCAAPISLHRSQDKALSLSVDKAQAYYGVYRRHYRRVYRRGYYGGGYGYYGYAHRPYGYYGYAHRPYGYYGYHGYYGRPYVGGYYGHQRRVARRVYRRHNYGY